MRHIQLFKVVLIIQRKHLTNSTNTLFKCNQSVNAKFSLTDYND